MPKASIYVSTSYRAKNSMINIVRIFFFFVRIFGMQQNLLLNSAWKIHNAKCVYFTEKCLYRAHVAWSNEQVHVTV